MRASERAGSTRTSLGSESSIEKNGSPARPSTSSEITATGAGQRRPSVATRYHSPRSGGVPATREKRLKSLPATRSSEEPARPSSR